MTTSNDTSVALDLDDEVDLTAPIAPMEPREAEAWLAEIDAARGNCDPSAETRAGYRIEAATARLLAAQKPYVPTPGHREETTREVARNRARDVVNHGSASRGAIDARAAVDCACEPWLIRDLYVAEFTAALRERNVVILP